MNSLQIKREREIKSQGKINKLERNQGDQNDNSKTSKTGETPTNQPGSQWTKEKKFLLTPKTESKISVQETVDKYVTNQNNEYKDIKKIRINQPNF